MPVIKYRYGAPGPAPSSYIGPLARTGPDRLETALSNFTSTRSLPSSELVDAKIEFDLAQGTRHVFTGARIWKTSRYPSYKSRRTLQLEGGPEQSLAIESEVDPGIVDYRTQPFSMSFSLSGATKIYTPDFIRLRGDGQIEVIEIKARKEDFLKDGYIDKLNQAGLILNAIGWQFYRIVRSGKPSNSFFDQNINFIQHCRFVELPEHLSAHLLMAVATHSTTTLTCSNAIKLLGGGLLGRSRLFKSMVCGITTFDISKPLTLQTSIYAAT